MAESRYIAIGTKLLRSVLSYGAKIFHIFIKRQKL